MTGELLGDARERMTQQQQLQMQDAANQQAYDEYKAQGAQRGFNNLIKAGTMAARAYMAVKTAGLSEGANLAVNAATNMASHQANSGQNVPMEGRSNWSGASNARSTQLNLNNNNNMRPSMTGRSNYSGNIGYPMIGRNRWNNLGMFSNRPQPYGGVNPY